MKNSYLKLILFFLLTTLIAKAQWVETNNGIYGGRVSAFAVNGTDIFVGTFGAGVFLSSDNGSNWTAINSGLSNMDVISLAISGSNIFAGTYGGIFLSANNGSNWVPVNTGLTNTQVQALAISGSNIFAGTYGGGVFLSTDNGSNWTAVNTGLTNTAIQSLTINGSNIFAGTYGGGVFLSADNGSNWTAINNGLAGTYIYALAVNGSDIFAGAFDGGVFRSTDNGSNWSAVNTGLTNTTVQSLTISGSNIFAGTYSAGLFLSSNNGSTWVAVNTGLACTNIYSLAVSGSDIFVGTYGAGVFLSSDNGSNWASVNTGLANKDIKSLVTNGSNIFAGTSYGASVFLSTNNGSSWMGFSTGLANSQSDVKALAISGSNIFAGIDYGGVFLSIDNGSSWTSVNTGLTNLIVQSLVINGTNIFAGTAGGVFLSIDNGSNWVAVNTGLNNLNVKSVVVNGTNIFAGTTGGVFLSTDNGSNWTAVNAGLTNTIVNSLLISGSNIFAGTVAGVFLSTNNGSNWTSSGLSTMNVNSLAISGNKLFAGAYGSGVFLSTDDGSNWVQINTGLSSTYYVYSLAVSDSQLFVGTYGKGVWSRPLSDFASVGVNVADSLALVALYNSTNGASWSNNTNWLTGTADTWYGVTVTNSRVSDLNLLSNNLSGTIPVELGNLTALTSLTLLANQLTGPIPIELGNLTNLASLSLGANQLSGSVPVEFNNLDFLQILDLGSNNLTDLPDLTGMAVLNNFHIQDNLLTFEDLQSNVGISGISYSPMKLIPAQPDQQIGVGSSLNISYTVGGTSNQYQWYKGLNLLSGAISNTYTKASTVIADTGRYYLKITSGIVAGLELQTDNTFITVLSGVKAIDSLALVDLYDSASGSGWTNKANWLTGPINTWQGVTVTSNKITALALASNNLVGKVPASVSTLTDLTSLDVSGNKLIGLPDLSALALLSSFKVENNKLEFDDLEPNVSIGGISYSPQDSIDVNQSVQVAWHAIQTLSSQAAGTANLYQWKKNGTDLASETNATLTMSAVEVTDEGMYFYTVTSSKVPSLTLTSRIKNLQVSTIDRDSLALKNLYDATGGAQWTNNLNWFSTPLQSGNWFGVTVINNKITAIDLSNNRLANIIPSDLASMSELASINVSGNSITNVPSLASLTKLTSVKLENNKLGFGALEPNASITGVTYVPQSLVSISENVLKQVGENQIFASGITGTANSYQWKKNGNAIAGATNADLILSNLTFKDDALYSFETTNSLVPGLTLISAVKTLRVSSLERDSLALHQLYMSTDGDHWANNSNWITTPLETGNWFGVTINNNRVTGLNLSGNKLKGFVPEVLNDIQNLTSLNLSSNNINQFPDLSSLLKLTSLDISHNNLAFASLIANSAIIGVDYSNQAELGVASFDSVAYGTDFQLEVHTPGEGNQYQWKRNGINITNAIDSIYIISSIGRNNMGDYHVEIVNSSVPGLALRSANQKVLATATLSGKLLATPGVAATKGKINLFTINQDSGFDTTHIKAINTDGSFALQKVVLDDYLLFGFVDTLTYAKALPSYYANTIYWEEADTIIVNSNIDNLDMISDYEPTNPPVGVGVISGYLTQDGGLPGGRSQKQQRVAGAGVSVRKVENTGRGQEEILTLVAYVYTDAQGNFKLPNLAPGNYRLNIQYPGYPMDPISFITMTIGDGIKSDVRVAAEVKDKKIKVTKITITNVWDKEDYTADVFPNPSVNYIQLKFSVPSTNRLIKLLDIEGRVVNRFIANSLMAQCDVSQLSPGVYILQVIDQDVVMKSIRVVKE